MTDPPAIYTVGQLADILQLAPVTIRHNARTGAWPSLKFGPRTIRFTGAHLADILTKSEAAPPQPRQTRRRRREIQ